MARDERTGSYSISTGMPRNVRDGLDQQHDRFGGISWGAAFFGWLSAMGLAVLLLAVLSAAGVAVGLTRSSASQLKDAAAGQVDQADSIGIAGAVAVLVILAVAYFAGGYVAGRMSRFDGARQGVAVWLIGLLITIVVAVLTAVLGAKYNVLSQLNLPRIPIDEGTLTGGGIIALVAVVVVTLLAALLGGKTGERYHRRIDRAAYDA